MRTLALILTLTACGSDHKSDSPAPEQTQQQAAVPTSLAIADASKLPACDAGHDQQLVYILSDKKFETCQAGAWQVIVIGPPAMTCSAQYLALKSIKLNTKLSDVPADARAVLGLSTTKSRVDANTCPSGKSTIYTVQCEDETAKVNTGIFLAADTVYQLNWGLNGDFTTETGACL